MNIKKLICLTIAILLPAIWNGAYVHSLELEQKKIYKKGSLYFDLEKGVCAGEDSSGAVADGCTCLGGSALEGANNSIEVYNYLIENMDLTPAQVSGIIGNLMNESGGNTYNLKPTVIGVGMCDPNCFGIVQWDTGRTAALRAWASSKGKDPNLIKVQAEFIKVELEGSESNAHSKLKAVSGDDEAAARKAAEQFDKWYERSNAGQAERQANAAKFFKEHVKGQGLTGSAPDSNQTCPGGEGSGSSSGQFAWPDDGRKDVISSCFGARSSPGGVGSTNHGGVDIGSGAGQNVTAADGGKVEQAGGDFNNIITIDHGNGFKTRYLHNESVAVEKNQKVSKGDVIGKVGSRGQSTGPHIHFEVVKNGSVDPLKHLPKEGRTVTGSNCPSRTF